MRRRAFLQTAMGAAGLQAFEKNTKAPGEGIRLGFDTYSVRAFEWKAPELVAYAASLKLDTLQISDLEAYESLETGYLTKVREDAARAGMTIDAGIGCICPLSKSWSGKHGSAAEYLIKGMQVAKAVGATSMRCFMGSAQDRQSGRPIEEFMDATVGVFRSVRAQAQDLGVRIALENHAGDMQAREVRTIITEAGPETVGSCLDTGNPMWVVEDPVVSLEVLGPYVVTTHVRDSAVFETDRGAAAQWVAVGDGNVDFGKFLALYKRVCPHAPMQLEIITGRPAQTLPYLEPEFWRPFPKAISPEFARFVALAKRGRPFMGSMVVEDSAGTKPPEYKAALKEQQRVDLERSITYAKQTLGAGVRWKQA